MPKQRKPKKSRKRARHGPDKTDEEYEWLVAKSDLYPQKSATGQLPKWRKSVLEEFWSRFPQYLLRKHFGTDVTELIEPVHAQSDLEAIERLKITEGRKLFNTIRWKATGRHSRLSAPSLKSFFDQFASIVRPRKPQLRELWLKSPGANEALQTEVEHRMDAWNKQHPQATPKERRNGRFGIQRQVEEEMVRQLSPAQIQDLKALGEAQDEEYNRLPLNLKDKVDNIAMSEAVIRHIFDALHGLTGYSYLVLIGGPTQHGDLRAGSFHWGETSSGRAFRDIGDNDKVVMERWGEFLRRAFSDQRIQEWLSTTPTVPSTSDEIASGDPGAVGEELDHDESALKPVSITADHVSTGYDTGCTSLSQVLTDPVQPLTDITQGPEPDLTSQLLQQHDFSSTEQQLLNGLEAHASSLTTGEPRDVGYGTSAFYGGPFGSTTSITDLPLLPLGPATWDFSDFSDASSLDFSNFEMTFGKDDPGLYSEHHHSDTTLDTLLDVGAPVTDSHYQDLHDTAVSSLLSLSLAGSNTPITNNPNTGCSSENGSSGTFVFPPAFDGVDGTTMPSECKDIRGPPSAATGVPAGSTPTMVLPPGIGNDADAEVAIPPKTTGIPKDANAVPFAGSDHPNILSSTLPTNLVDIVRAALLGMDPTVAASFITSGNLFSQQVPAIQESAGPSGDVGNEKASSKRKRSVGGKENGAASKKSKLSVTGEVSDLSTNADVSLDTVKSTRSRRQVQPPNRLPTLATDRAPKRK